MGNGDFTIEYPPLHEIASSHNPYIRKLDAFLTYLNPEPHRRAFLKPFMRLDSPEYCATCHKVHLDQPVNHYRWLRGFNEYDNWQASGVSGQGARSFYYPAKPATCADCHMPLVASQRSRQSRRQGALAPLSRRPTPRCRSSITMKSNCAPPSSFCNRDSLPWTCSPPVRWKRPRARWKC